VQLSSNSQGDFPRLRRWRALPRPQGRCEIIIGGLAPSAVKDEIRMAIVDTTEQML
jgi:hypothetical protein